MEDQAQLVSADDGRQDDSACRAAADGKARRRDSRRGQRQSRDLRVAAAGGRERDREGRQKRAGVGNTLAGGVRRIMSSGIGSGARSVNEQQGETNMNSLEDAGAAA